MYRSTSETGLNPPVKYFAYRSNAVLFVVDLLCFFCLVFAMALYASVYMCLMVTCWEMADLLFVVSNCKFVTFPLVF